MAKAKPKKEFSESTLLTLQEPITVNLRKIMGGRPSPIDLPPGPGEEIGGRGYTQDMVRSLPSFISNEWSGGGMYDCTATGSNSEEMHWEMYFPPNQVPELVPPTRSQAQTSFSQQPAPQPAPPQQNSSVMNTGGYLSQVSQTYRQNPQQYSQPAGGTAPAHNPFGWQGSYTQGPSSSRYGGQDYGAMAPYGSQSPVDSSAAKEREERLKLEAKMERQAQQAQHEKEMAAVTAEMRRLAETVSKRPSDDESPALKAAMAKISSLEQQGTTNSLMQQMQAMQESTNRMFERMAADNDRKIEEMRRAAENNKPDQTLPMMMQMMSQQATTAAQSQQTFIQFMQANQTQQLESARLAQASQMRPQEMLDLFRAGNSGADQMAHAYGKAWELMSNGVEQILHAQGPGVHPALAMLGQGVEGGLGMAQQYLEMKQAETQANAQARSIQSQMDAQTRIKTAEIKANAAEIKANAAAPRAPYVPATEQISTAGEGEEIDGEEDGEEIDGEEELIVDTAAQMAEREEALFGEALPHVMRLRKGVASGAISPAQTAAALFQAAEHFGTKAAQGEELPPIFALFQEERFADLVDAMIPEAKAQFRDEASSAIYTGIAAMKNHAGKQAQPA